MELNIFLTFLNAMSECCNTNNDNKHIFIKRDQAIRNHQSVKQNQI